MDCCDRGMKRTARMPHMQFKPLWCDICLQCMKRNALMSHTHTFHPQTLIPSTPNPFMLNFTHLLESNCVVAGMCMAPQHACHTAQMSHTAHTSCRCRHLYGPHSMRHTLHALHAGHALHTSHCMHVMRCAHACGTPVNVNSVPSSPCHALILPS